jgi:hypothetical protein
MLMALFEHSPLPGAPYLLACVLAFWAFLHSCDLPLDPEQVMAKYRGLQEGDVRTSTCSYPDMSDTDVMPLCMYFLCFVHRFCFVVLLQLISSKLS